METLQVGLAGFGTVGTGVAQILLDDTAWLERRTGMPVRLRCIADLDLERDRGLCLEGVALTRDVHALTRDPGIQVVIELIGGVEPARTLVLEALGNGKHVITANKALLAAYGGEIFQAAAAAGVHVAFEASVGGGIPVVRCIREGLASDRIVSMAGIINGTANYILSAMAEKGLDFPECLHEAQAKGYAEADPSLDIEGQDTAHKLAILVALAHGVQIRPEQIFTEGIQHITGRDIRYARELGYSIKLLAICVAQGQELAVRVHPTMIPCEHMLANVNHAFNAVFVTGVHSGPVMFYGQGAGRMPTAAAVASDLVDLGRRLRAGGAGRSHPLGFYEDVHPPAALRSTEDLVTNYYLRFPVADRPGVLARISGVLGAHEISIHSVIQQGRRGRGPVHVIILTHEALERNVQAALREINGLEVMRGPALLVRIEHAVD